MINLFLEGMVERIPDTKDRRVIKISITQKGHDYIKESRKWVNKNIKNNLSPLNSKELEQMYSCIETLKNKVLKNEEDHNGIKPTTRNTD